MMIDEATWLRIRTNIFETSWPAALSLPPARWHTDAAGRIDADARHSSQALALDVFGTLQSSGSRDAVLNALATRLGLPTNAMWEVVLEHTVEPNLLAERRRTQIDAFAEGANSFIVFECKFTEAGGGGCSQPVPIESGPHKGARQCTGRLEMQTNPVNGKRGLCALTEKGIGYWRYILALFEVPAPEDRSKCPFAGENYQWMRNIVHCSALSKHKGVPGGFILAYAARAGLPMSDKIDAGTWPSMLKLRGASSIPISALSFQELVDLALSVPQEDGMREVWRLLAQWIARKIADVSVA